jgi:hypothetical protein
MASIARKLGVDIDTFSSFIEKNCTLHLGRFPWGLVKLAKIKKNKKLV